MKAGNVGPPSSVAFTIDTVPPNVTIVLEPEYWEFPNFIPFQEVFLSDDADGAIGEVVHEWILVGDCVVYDGLTYGDGDGLLLDESAEIHEDEMCRLRRLCDEEVWEDPVIEVWATDCGGNMSSASYVKTGTYVAFRCR